MKKKGLANSANPAFLMGNVMSLKKYSLSEISVLHIQTPNGDPMYLDDAETKPVLIKLYGVGSNQYQMAERKRQDSLANKFKKYRNKTIPSEELEELRVDFLVRCVAGSENFELDGEEGAALYSAVFSDRSLIFVTEQVERFIGDQVNFTNQPSTN